MVLWLQAAPAFNDYGKLLNFTLTPGKAMTVNLFRTSFSACLASCLVTGLPVTTAVSATAEQPGRTVDYATPFEYKARVADVER